MFARPNCAISEVTNLAGSFERNSPFRCETNLPRRHEDAPSAPPPILKPSGYANYSVTTFAPGLWISAHPCPSPRACYQRRRDKSGAGAKCTRPVLVRHPRLFTRGRGSRSRFDSMPNSAELGGRAPADVFKLFEFSALCNQEINYDSPRGGVSVITEKGETTTSHLLVQRAKTPDSGRYTCAPANANPRSVHVHVLSGEHPAAMQHGGQLRLQYPLSAALLSFMVAFMGC
ncbi:hypothetical protein EVAR_41185_1 [Eumeta japonica]|uniref:Ig-like domain-containing protein n=1 Tax=Eumeta variegata TaxID=151549 RepID=A0A4C1WSQ2_EUMVA|nr:hypothetical protein EVAR_41185_1 [Eumeta japonica]